MGQFWCERQTVKVIWRGMEYCAIVKLFCVSDANYAADADGNRGISKNFIEKIEIEKVQTVYEDQIDEIPKNLKELITEAVE